MRAPVGAFNVFIAVTLLSDQAVSQHDLYAKFLPVAFQRGGQVP